jgi:hypothetical protein
LDCLPTSSFAFVVHGNARRNMSIWANNDNGGGRTAARQHAGQPTMLIQQHKGLLPLLDWSIHLMMISR